MNPQITQLLSRLDELTDDEAGELRELIVADFTALDHDEALSTREVAAIHELGGAADRLTVHLGRTSMGKLSALSASGQPAGAVQRMARRGGKPVPSPEATTGRGTALVASAQAVGAMQGQPFTSKWDLAESMAETLNSLGGDWHGKVVVASAKFDYPEERRLDDSLTNCERRMDAVAGPQALLATGGICQPVGVDYNVPTWATAERPLRDGLPAFEATRGGIRFVTPPDIAEWESATGIWTAATDAEPGGATKPVKTMVCGEEQTVIVEAVSTRISFGNMQARFAPEQVAANTELAIAAAARVAENNLLALIEAAALKDVTSAKTFGATRDLLTMLDQAVGGYRQTHRISDGQAITVILPRWVRDLIRADVAREIGHSQNDYFNSLAVTDDDIVTMLRARGVNPIFHLDGQASTAKYPNQFFALPVAESAIKTFPTKAVWYLFVEGSISYLDAGRLDLGIVRDSTLDATNDFETFVETFESIANRGFAHGIVQYVSELCASGGSSGTVAPVCP